MNTAKVMMVRIYLTDNYANIKTLLKRLHDWEKVRGVTVFEAMAGFGPPGFENAYAHDISIPIVVEFFDDAEKIAKVLDDLSGFIAAEHIVTWEAQLVSSSKGVA